MSLPNSPNNRKEVYLSNIAGQGTALPTAPQDREEMYLDYIAKNGGGGGGTGDGDMKKSIYDSDLAVASAGGIKSYVSGAIADKVDKVQGKGLSTNDYDDTAKEIVDGVSTALDGKVSKSNTAGLLKNDGTVDTTTYATSTSVSAILDGTTIDSFGDVESALADKAAASDVSTIQGLIPSSATTSNKLATASDIQEIEGNPSGSATAGDLTKLKIDNDIFSIPSGGSSGTTVVPNPSGTATADLNKVQIGTDIYDIPDTTYQSKQASSGGTDVSLVTTGEKYTWNEKVSKSQTAGLLKNDGTVNTTIEGAVTANTNAISAIKDGTNIDSFGDVETALGNKADKVSSPTNGDFASLDSNGNLADSGKKASDFAIASSVTNILDGQSLDSFGDVESALDDKVDWESYENTGAINLLDEHDEIEQTHTENGITITKYDNHFTLEGTATDRVDIAIVGMVKINALRALYGNLRLTGCNSNFDTSTYFMYISTASGNKFDRGEGIEITEDLTYSWRVQIKAGTAFTSPVAVYPMVTPISYKGNTFIPHAKTNRELTEDVAKLSGYFEQSVTLSTSATTTVTFTDASITANSQIQYGCSTWGIIPDDITCSSGSCVVTMPKVASAATVTVRIYVR